ncbi:hypothetical protein ES332_A01G183400v1 [Gossypium tomentosum]|uniref:Uncharacterized protein n=1 Tax=Gossypium tomentosum TaxID=34277 RepID=A0A5D2RV03_GOSTO|nr:hypothetical protein ES332_A01G183400v1 [Gossypium tomentosum]
MKRGSKPGKEEEEKQDYYVNMGYAIRTLREEFLDIFYRELIFLYLQMKAIFDRVIMQRNTVAAKFEMKYS